MECDKCGREAVIYTAYSGAHLCDAHFVESVERRVRQRIRDDGLLDTTATPDDPDTWLIGLSGGKDSVVLTTILEETFGPDPRVELVALTIHEGIDEYRDASIEACRSLTADLDLRHEIVSYREEFDVRMDAIAADDPEDMAACAYCGVFRRDILDRYAQEVDADKLLTGHNLDDEAETALMNILEGDIEQIAKHFDASLGALDDRHEQADFIPRAKPLRDIPEREVALYARLRELPVHMAECPHAATSFRGEIQDLLHTLEENHPGTRHSIMAGYEKLAALAADEYGETTAGERLDRCQDCGRPTTRDRCRTCALLDAVGGSRQHQLPEDEIAKK